MLSHKTISKLAGAPSQAVLLLAFCAPAYPQSNATLLGGVVGQNGANVLGAKTTMRQRATGADIRDR